VLLPRFGRQLAESGRILAVDKQEIGHLRIPFASVALPWTAPCGLLFLGMTNEVSLRGQE
jgi:hypothetical protein